MNGVAEDVPPGMPYAPDPAIVATDGKGLARAADVKASRNKAAT